MGEDICSDNFTTAWQGVCFPSLGALITLFPKAIFGSASSNSLHHHGFIRSPKILLQQH